jgi:hypothetical protein
MKADKLVNEILKQMSVLDVDQMEVYVDMMATAMICTMRGLHGDDYVNGFLTSALNDEDPVKITPHLKQ